MEFSCLLWKAAFWSVRQAVSAFGSNEHTKVTEQRMRHKEANECLLYRYYLRGPKMGQKEIFIDGLPGSPDNIRSNRKGGFFISLIAPRYSDVSSYLRSL